MQVQMPMFSPAPGVPFQAPWLLALLSSLPGRTEFPQLQGATFNSLPHSTLHGEQIRFEQPRPGPIEGPCRV